MGRGRGFGRLGSTGKKGWMARGRGGGVSRLESSVRKIEYKYILNMFSHQRD